MAELKSAEIGQIGLIQQQADGRIIQLGLTEDQSNVLQILVASMSREIPLLKLDGDNELIPKWKVKSFNP